MLTLSPIPGWRGGGGFKKTEEGRKENDSSSTVRFNEPRIIQLFGANLLDEELERWRLHGFYLQLSIIEYAAPESSQSGLLSPSSSLLLLIHRTPVFVKSVVVVVPVSPFFLPPSSRFICPSLPSLSSLPTDTL